MRVWNQLGSGKEVHLFDAAHEKLFAERWPDETSPETFRTAFFVSSQIIQLMENVYMTWTWRTPGTIRTTQAGKNCLGSGPGRPQFARHGNSQATRLESDFSISAIAI